MNASGRITLRMMAALLASTLLTSAMAQNQPVLVSPATNATNIGIAPVLQANLSDPGGRSLSVLYYGRKAPSTSGPKFAIVALPDTQYYSASLSNGLPAMFTAQTDWIQSNRLASNIVYVVHLGDCSEHGDGFLSEWQNVTNAMYRLENPVSIPYGVAVGNHDQTPNTGYPLTDTTSYYNKFFGVSHFAGRPYYGGHYGTNSDSHYDLFSAGGTNFIAIFVEYDSHNQDPAMNDWARNLLTTYSNRKAIIVSHYIGDPGNPCTFGTQGAALYQAVRTNGNVFLMLSGHVDGEGFRQDTFNGATVTTLVSDYQFRTDGGGGYMRIMDFEPEENTVSVSTYSPWANQYQTAASSQFSFAYDMQVTNDNFGLFGSRSSVVSGSTPSVVWSGLKTNTTYEWYVKINNGTNIISGPMWRFTTGAGNLPPVTTNLTFAVSGDFSTNCQLSASDPNDDSLTFQISSAPQHGTLQNFSSSSGSFVYSPAHGYVGTDNLVFVASDTQTSSLPATVDFNVLPPSDTNHDGLPDYWAAKYGVSDPAADPDGDGFSNLQEYLANTNPTNSNSGLRILGATIGTSGWVTIKWSSVGGSRYRVQYCQGGFVSGGFLDIARPAALEMDPAPAGSASTQSFTDDFTLHPGAPGSPACYYRIKIEN